LPSLFNALSDVDFRVIVGDNFYDRDGGITSRFFSRLSAEAKAQFSLTVPGNHDFWTDGTPVAKSAADQFGNGFFQYYGMDAHAGKTWPLTAPFNLSVPPGLHGHLPPAGNYFYYNKIGNTGFIGYSGAHSLEEHGELFAESCSYFDTEPRPEVIFLLGHWSEPGLGCPVGMSTPEVYRTLGGLGGCNHGTLRYVMGHTHCNRVAAVAPPIRRADGGLGSQSKGESVGYLIGGAGVRGDFMGCNTLGFGYFEAGNGGNELMVGFDLANETHDQFDAALHCFGTKGVASCLEYGTVWRNTTQSG